MQPPGRGRAERLSRSICAVWSYPRPALSEAPPRGNVYQRPEAGIFVAPWCSGQSCETLDLATQVRTPRWSPSPTAETPAGATIGFASLFRCGGAPARPIRPTRSAGPPRQGLGPCCLGHSPVQRVGRSSGPAAGNSGPRTSPGTLTGLADARATNSPASFRAAPSLAGRGRRTSRLPRTGRAPPKSGDGTVPGERRGGDRVR